MRVILTSLMIMVFPGWGEERKAVENEVLNCMFLNFLVQKLNMKLI